MGHRAAGQYGQHVEQVIGAGPQPHGFAQRDHQIKDRVEEDWYAEQETAGHEGQPGPSLSHHAKREANYPIGRAAIQKTLANDGRHGDQDADAAAGLSKGIGHSFGRARMDELVGRLGRPFAAGNLLPAVVHKRLGRGEHGYRQRGQQQCQEGMQPQQQNATQNDADGDQQNPTGMHERGVL